eukprot:TRINITY_DN5078_c0_g1_i2.p1 TRINITY_DN5078_c0_g1~~TRINITY_DN5078_c0_g1_i2.p1  ORF type:complete len:197 (-),score=37.92 TRINITY_DN5078_c0_g1_i2:71-661(-)
MSQAPASNASVTVATLTPCPSILPPQVITTPTRHHSISLSVSLSSPLAVAPSPLSSTPVHSPFAPSLAPSPYTATYPPLPSPPMQSPFSPLQSLYPLQPPATPAPSPPAAQHSTLDQPVPPTQPMPGALQPTAEDMSSNDAHTPPGVSLCKVCRNEVNVVLLPCGHLCLCAGCAASRDRCPVCDAHIEQAHKVFLA